MHLRLRTKNGLITITVSQQCTIRELSEEIERKTGIEVAKQKILYGFPQRELRADADKPVESVLQSGDSLTVDKLSAETEQERTVESSPASTENAYVRRKVPDDNSCLFHAICYVFRSGSVAQLRHIISETVRLNPDLYTEAFLGKSNHEYSRWILLPETWGGAIELSILSKYFQTEISVFDIQTLRLDRYGEAENYEERVFLLYDGIHYDPIARAFLGASREYDVTVFKIWDNEALVGAKSVAEEANKNRQYTDLASFTLMCRNCGAKLKGETSAVEHAKQTGHTNFTEA
ncbi:4-hydroxybenzoyl-CoA thioesterase [Galdieria sulphuraria]|uniref:Ubiquitin thioesterase OTU n=1 Tax=Galdieria sulphuraria TaxID=130081 RepID=M2X7N7_GALSU|nr:4-hydroxybenzoyl-CoA thioesterase [Galdieria sulphuraria]EME32545.1 4-hydroxybenzoyl-CoA thioesterase [Galdieria sulphuraria]|eukprot:XP_005709065.1 4-hydroxybenzoyl-CoA thioesterase [Galdieria sulphuraria]